MRTSRARAKIQAWFKHQARDQNLDEGRTLFEREMRRLDVEGLDLAKLAKAVNYQNADDMYAALGAGDLRIGQVLHQAQQLFGETDDQEQLDRLLAKPRRQPSKATQSDITVRIIEVEWGERAHTRYPVTIEIQAWDRSGLLRDVTGLLGNERVNVLAVNTLTDTDEGIARLRITLEVDGLESLGRLFSRIQQLPNVTEVRRLRNADPEKSARKGGA